MYKHKSILKYRLEVKCKVKVFSKCYCQKNIIEFNLFKNTVFKVKLFGKLFWEHGIIILSTYHNIIIDSITLD